jgi:hypothetical protein
MTDATATHHDGDGWLADVAIRGVLYSGSGRAMRSLSLPEVLVVCAGCVVAHLPGGRHERYVKRLARLFVHAIHLRGQDHPRLAV